MMKSVIALVLIAGLSTACSTMESNMASDDGIKHGVWRWHDEKWQNDGVDEKKWRYDDEW